MKMTLWERIKWKLFGETKIFGWIIGMYLFLMLTIFGLVGYVIFHFISKFW